MIVQITLLSTILATVASAQFQIAGYWGEDRSGIQGRGSEPSLLEACDNYDIVNIAYLREFISFDGLPGMSLSDHCRRVHPALSPNRRAGFRLLDCPEIGNHITLCQKKGTKVMLSASPFSPIQDDGQAVEIASTLWNLFLNGTQSEIERPFGDAVLDGIDLLVRNNDHTGYVQLVKELRRLADAEGKPLTINVSTRCDFPDQQFGPNLDNRVLTNASDLIDSVTVFMTSSPTCSATLNPEGFRQRSDEWLAWGREHGKTISLGLPSIGEGYEPWVDAAVGDQPPASMIPEIVRKVDGVALFDSSFDLNGAGCLCQHTLSTVETEQETIITSCQNMPFSQLWAMVADGSNDSLVADLMQQRGNITFSQCEAEKQGSAPAEPRPTHTIDFGFDSFSYNAAPSVGVFAGDSLLLLVTIAVLCIAW